MAERANVQPTLLLPGSPTLRRGNRVSDELNAYMRELILRRKAAPTGDDFISTQ